MLWLNASSMDHFPFGDDTASACRSAASDTTVQSAKRQTSEFTSCVAADENCKVSEQRTKTGFRGYTKRDKVVISFRVMSLGAQRAQFAIKPFLVPLFQPLRGLPHRADVRLSGFPGIAKLPRGHRRSFFGDLFHFAIHSEAAGAESARAGNRCLKSSPRIPRMKKPAPLMKK